jgi:pSer/pThr/pTyr-binding forkhead associated (FHA) protein
LPHYQAQEKMQNQFIVTAGSKETIFNFDLNCTILKIGSDPKWAEILISENGVSGRNAYIEFQPDGIFLVDLGSRCRTYVNGLFANKQQIFPGDIVKISNVEILFNGPIEIKETSEETPEEGVSEEQEEVTLGEKTSFITSHEEHKLDVQKLMFTFANLFIMAGISHDDSKMTEPEFSGYAKALPKLKAAKYGTEEYKKAVASLGPALQAHYKNNSHHPEHFENGVSGMTLLDVLEMFCDWHAAGARSGSDQDSIVRRNIERFGISEELASVLLNTNSLLEKK